MTQDQRKSMLDLARRFFAAITAGDIDAVREMYAPDAVVWHNNDGIEQGVEQNLAVLRWVTKNITGFRYEDVRCQATDTGFVEQHITRGRAPNGADLAMSACIVCTVVDGRITRVDEYLDSAQLAPLLAQP